MLIGDVWITSPMVNALSEQIGVHRTTVARWLKNGRFPAAIALLLEMLLSRKLGPLHDAWSGWSIDRDGELTAPTGYRVTAGEILAMQLRRQHTAALELELRELRAEVRHHAAWQRCVDRSLESAEVGADRVELSVVSL